MPKSTGRMMVRPVLNSHQVQAWLVLLGACVVGAESRLKLPSLAAAGGLVFILVAYPLLIILANWRQAQRWPEWASLQMAAATGGVCICLLILGSFGLFLPSVTSAGLLALATLLAAQVWLVPAVRWVWLDDLLAGLLPPAAASLGLVLGDSLQAYPLVLVALGLWAAGWHVLTNRSGPRARLAAQLLFGAALLSALGSNAWMAIVLTFYLVIALRFPLKRVALSDPEQVKLLLLSAAWLAMVLLKPSGRPLTTAGLLVIGGGLAAVLIILPGRRWPHLRQLVDLRCLAVTIERLPDLDWSTWQRALAADYRHLLDDQDGHPVDLLGLISAAAIMLAPYYLLTRLAFLTSPLAPPLLFAALILPLIAYAASGRRFVWAVILYPLCLLVSLGLLLASLGHGIGYFRSATTSTPVEAPQ